MHPDTLALIMANPEIKEFIDSGPDRFKHGTTTCDGEDCIAQLTPNTFFVHVTPQRKPMMVCVRCLHKYRIKNNIEFNN